MRSLTDIAKDIKRISLLAAAEIMEIYEDPRVFEVEVKSDNSPLTRADKAANDVIVKELNALPEQYPIISEELKSIPFEMRKNYKRLWLVDPLDGTKEFIKRNGEFTVNIALIENAAPILGVVQVPVTGEIYWGALGQGAFYNNGTIEEYITCSKFSKKAKGLRVVCSRSHINAATQEYIDQYNEPVKVSQGSSLKFIVLSRGRAELYPRLGPTMEWDTAAAHIILEEAGGEVLEYESGEPLRYNKEDLLNPHFIAQGALIES